MEEPVTEEDILKLKPMGSFLYLSMLRAPFFKIDGDYFHIKEIKGNGHFWVAVHKEHTCYVEKIKILVES